MMCRDRTTIFALKATVPTFTTYPKEPIRSVRKTRSGTMASSRSAFSAVTSSTRSIPLRRFALARNLTTTPTRLSNIASTYRNPSSDPLYRPDFPENLPIPRSALAALGARLELKEGGEDKVLVCLTDRSWDESKVKSLRRPVDESEEGGESTTSSTKVDGDTTVVSSSPASASPNNQVLSSLGNALLGLFTSEHLSTLYPNLPTRVLKSSVSAYCGISACSSVGRELGVGVNVSSSEGSGKTKLGKAEGLRVRWVRNQEGVRKRGWEDVMADSVRALVGLVYQERVGPHLSFTLDHHERYLPGLTFVR